MLLVDPLSSRVFVKCNIVDGLSEKIKGVIKLVHNIPKWQELSRSIKAENIEIVNWGDKRCDLPFLKKIWYIIDQFLDRHIGFYPLALRFNLLHKMNLDRLRPNHNNYFFDLNYQGCFPNWPIIYRLMEWWTFSKFRFVEPEIKNLLEKQCQFLIVSNPQNDLAIKFILCAYRLKLPIVCYIASWDHPVGKGVIFPLASLYLVQNVIMKEALTNLHNIPAEKIKNSGWPQSDHFCKYSEGDYGELLRKMGITSSKKCILYAGNTETNNPHEYAFINRLVKWWQEKANNDRVVIIFRPHPKDSNYKKRYFKVTQTQGLFLQEPSYTDIGELGILLRNVDCVITNAGTIQLDSIANDRPTICVMYDEHSEGKETFADKNVQGEHYKMVLESGAFHHAHDFMDVEVGISKCLNDPGEHSDERKALTDSIYGIIDGKSSSRVIDCIVEEFLHCTNI